MDRLNKSTSANCADKRKKQSSRFSAMCFFILLHCAFVAKADEWNFQASGTYNVSSDKTFTGSVNVGSNTLTLNVTNSVVFLRNYQDGSTSMFKISGGTLIINGADGKVVTFDGNFDIDDVYANGLPGSYVGPRSSEAIFMTGTSTVELHYVDFTNFLCNRRYGNQSGGGVISFVNGNNLNNGTATFDHINFYKCYAGIPDQEEPTSGVNSNKWGRIINIQSGTWNITMTNSSIRHCYINEPYSSNPGINGMGGAIRSQGNVGGTLRLTDCAFEDNLYYDRYTGELAGQGGVINWRSGNNTGSNPAHLIIKDCRFVRNKAKQGGAIATNAKITIERNTTDATKYTYISKNEAVEGGGIYFWTYNGGQASYDGDGFDAILGDDTAPENSDYLRIYDNYARDFGGGVYIAIDPSRDVGFNSAGTPISPNFYVRFYKGCSVSYNRSPKGAGVAIIDNAGNKHYNGADQTPANTWSGVYNRHIYFDGSKVENNKTLLKNGEAVPSEVAGGGIYISKQRSPDASFSNDFDDLTNGGGGLLTVDLVSGTCSGNNAVAGTFVLNEHFNDDQESPFDDSETGTSPGYGGGYYIASLFEGTVNSTLNVNIGETGENLEMYGNQAYTDGGGVYVLYDREDGRQNEGTVTVEGGTIGKTDLATGNKALNGNGGGICVMGGTVYVNGGNVEYNTAGLSGGGVYVSVPNDQSTTTIQGGANISYNTAKGGGGVYVDKGELDVFGNTWNSVAGAWEMLDWTSYTDPASEATHTRITNNSATDGNGGGINAGNGEVDITNTLIYNNTASGTVSKGRGGGVYLDGGIIKIVSSKILYNTAETNGGGIDDHSGDIEIYGGDISRNKATNGRGGGIYTNAGDIRIWPSALYGNPVSAPSLNDCKNTGTVFSYNTAGTNGGGLNTHIGRLDVRYANVHHNEAGHNYQSIGTSGGRGGGMFCEGPHADLSGYTVRLLHTYLDNNKAFGNSDEESNLTGRGGGLYLKYGSIFAEHCYVRYNEADINGGGLDNHDGELRVYGTFVEDNQAKNGKGGGLYTDKGNLVVGPCDSYGFVESKASSICNNTAYINGGGINNHHGNITIHGDRINNNTAVTGDGGGVYINSGQIYMYGGQINNNKADQGKGGGVYGGGGTFNIMEREAHPILEILDVEDITTSGFTIHFHHVDRGLAMEEDAESKEYGIAFSETPYPSDLGENVEWTVGTGTNTDWTGVTKVSFIPTSTQPTPLAPHSYNQDEGCSRFVASGLDSGKTYYVVAYGKYTYGGKNYFDASPAIAVKTHGNNPVVVTGVAFDITTNSASVNGKLFYGGVGTLLAKGIEISSDNGATWVKHPAQSVGNVFSVTFSGLEPSKIYKARAYAKCQSGGTQYESQDAEIITFFTLGNSPVVSTGEATGTTETSATVSGELLYKGDGSGTVTKGIRYSKNGENSWTNVPSSGSEAVFSVNLTGLEPDTDYQAQAYATNDEYTGYGEIITFTTATGSKAPQGPRSVYPAVEENPFFQELTPLQQAMLASTPEADSTEAPASGATTERSRDNDTPVNIPQINENTAMYGGGICIDHAGAELVFAGSREANPSDWGQINLNYASEAGGGIYIGRQSANEYAMMQMMGKCEVNRNRVPAGKLGGGIYLDGRFYVGDKDTDPIGTHGLKVDKNFAIDKEQDDFEAELAAVIAGTALPEVSAQYGPKTLNNVFLPRSDYDYKEHGDDATTEKYNKVSVITLLSDVSGYANPSTHTNPYSHIGFSVPNGFCPVIATAKEFGGDYKVHKYTDPVVGDTVSEFWLYNLMSMAQAGGDGMAETMKGAVFEDSESYVAIHTRRDNAPFRLKYIYLWGCWTHPIVKNDPETKNPMSKAHGYEKAGEEVYFLGHYKIKNPGDYTGNTENGVPSGDKALEWEIYSPEGLAWFTSYVNGLNVFDESGENHNKDANDEEGLYHFNWSIDQNPKAIATIMNDLDMSAYLWVPIGSVQKFYQTALASEDASSLFVDSETQVKIDNANDSRYTKDAHYYRGTFDGQGHIIKGLQGLYLTGIEKFGLFGYLADDAVVKNTFVDEGLFVSDNDEVIYSAGGIAGTMKLIEGEQSGEVPVISNSEARMNFNAIYSAANTTVGGLVGNMNNGHIHSCMAMPSITTSTTTTGQYVGGLVGKMDAGTLLENSFANVLFTTVPVYKVGGIVGDNNGIINNVYVRYNNADNTPNLPRTKFYWIAGNNSDKTKVQYCFAPYGKTGDGDEKWSYADEPGVTQRRLYKPTELESGKYGFAHKDQEVEKFDDDDNNDYIPTTTGLTYKDKKVQFNGLVDALNNWVADNPGHTPWTRTMASTINDDYPVLMFNDFNVVGTEDGIYMKYDDNVNDMWKKPNYKSLAIADRTGKDFQGLTSYNNPKAAMYLYKTNGVTDAKTTPVAINVTGNTAVPLHIHENIGITQAEGNEELTARVGVTFDNTNRSTSLLLGGEPYDWHMFSSALKAAPVGITYNSRNNDPETGGIVNYPPRDNYTTLLATGITDADFKERSYMDPPVITWNTAPGTVGYFPTDTPYGKWRGNTSYWPTGQAGCSFDFYCFDEKSRHWINFKREGTPAFMDHWHEDIDGSGKHQNLRYENESTLQVGKGYMMGVSKVSILMADGILNNGEFVSEEPLSNLLYSFNMSGYSEELRGLNLVGNPYQSYLDFNALVEDNSGTIYSNTYHLFDADKQRYISYTYDQSDNDKTAPRVIHPHQGFFIRTANHGAQLNFNNTMRAATGNEYSYFRGQNRNYPLVNLLCYDVDGFYDLTTVEMNRPELGGGEKLKDMRFGNSLLYASMDGTDYQVLFAPEGTSTVAVRFKASQNGVYTMRWETMHGDFQHLHLIDNLAGVDVDCMRQSEYRFEATTTDYLSRFKLVFDVTDIEENADEAESATFAFQMGDELVVNGSGELSVFDVQGRCIASQRLAGTQSSISLPRAASGMYILRLTGDKQVKTQKLIIK